MGKNIEQLGQRVTIKKATFVNKLGASGIRAYSHKMLKQGSEQLEFTKR